MASLNKILLIGNLGRDPEVRDYQNTKIVSFSLAVNENYKKANGEAVERTEWFRVTFWGGNLADVAEKYLKKGSQVFVEGRLSTNEYTDKEGKNRTALEVRGAGLTLLGSKSEASDGSYSSGSGEAQVESFQNDTAEDELPF